MGGRFQLLFFNLLNGRVDGLVDIDFQEAESLLDEIQTFVLEQAVHEQPVVSFLGILVKLTETLVLFLRKTKFNAQI